MDHRTSQQTIVSGRLRTVRIDIAGASPIGSSSIIGERLGGSRHGPRTYRVGDMHRQADAWQHEVFMTVDSDIPTRQDNQQALDDLVALLDLETIEVNVFRGASTDEDRVRVFGGQVAGQALIAAGRTIDEPDRHVHSLHAYFLRPGDPKLPILYEVDRIRDGRSFSTRRVVAIQHGRAIFNLQASFHDDEPGGPDHQITMDEGLAPPTELPDFHTRMAPHRERIGDWYHRPRPIDLRYVDGDPMSRQGELNTAQHVWIRANGSLPDDPLLNACILTYASDMTLLDTTLLPFGLPFDHPGLQMASLDHAMWFHRPFRVEDWLMYQQRAISTGASRGLAGGAIFTSDGALAVSVVQEGLARFTQ